MCNTLLDTGSLASFSQEKLWLCIRSLARHRFGRFSHSSRAENIGRPSWNHLYYS